MFNSRINMKLSFLRIALFAMILPLTLSAQTKMKKITLGGGCFWCLDATYRLVPGVKSVVSGYAGGKTKNPSYEDVSSGSTGHAEVVQVEYDPEEVSLEKLLDFFWKIHDPTTLNAQGADHGTQYRSIILYADDEQKAEAEKSKTAAQEKFSSPIVTQVLPLTDFYAAE